MRKMLPIALCGSAALVQTFANPAFALQISDGQYAGVYNGKNLAAAQTRMNAIQARDGVAVGTVMIWTEAREPDDSWLECDGRPVDPAKYPDLYARMTKTPNYANRFVRAGNAANVGQNVEDSIKSHTSTIAPHTHIFEGGLASTAVSGTANGQVYQKAGGGSGGYLGGNVFITNYAYTVLYSYHDVAEGYTNELSRYHNNVNVTYDLASQPYWQMDWYYSYSLMTVYRDNPRSGNISTYNANAAASSLSNTNVNNGTVNGTNSEASQTAVYDGGEETAPKHVMGRYFIKAR